jgi:hypothetical protein
MTSCIPISIPLEQNVKLSAYEGDLVQDTTMYKHIVRNLIYMTTTRLDLSYAIRVVNQFMQTPQKPHLDAVRRILRYIKHIRKKKLARKSNLIHVSTEYQIVDIFTKALGINKLKRFRKMLGVLKVDLSLRGNVDDALLTPRKTQM